MPHTIAFAPAASARRTAAESAIPPAATSGIATNSYLAHEFDSWQASFDVATRLDPLRYQHIGTGVHSLDGRSDLSDLDERARTGTMNKLDQVTVDPPGERDQPHPLIEGELQPLMLLEREDQVDTKRLLGRRANAADLSSQFGRVGP